MIVRTRILFVGLCAALLASGCGTNHIRSLREAQDTFNQASDRHNRAVLSAQATQDPLQESAEAVSGFRIAAGLAGSLIEKNRDDLVKDNLLCTAFVIQAMSLWKLGDYDSAVGIARRSDDCAPGEKARAQLARERVTLKAIPGLVRIDQANALMMNGKPSVDEYVLARDELMKALGELKDAGKLVGNDHPVRGYLIVSRLAAIRVWHSGTASKGLTATTKPTSAGERAAARDTAIGQVKVERHYLQCLTHRSDKEVVDALKGWRDLFVITDDKLIEIDCARPMSEEGVQ